MKLCPGGWKNNFERMNMKVDEDNEKSVVMVNGLSRKSWQLSSNTFWNNTGCLVSAPTFLVGGSRLW